MGMAQGAVHGRWRGTRQWHLSELGDVADVLGVSVNDLITTTAREQWAHRDSNPEPTDYKSATFGQVWTVAA